MIQKIQGIAKFLTLLTVLWAMTLTTSVMAKCDAGFIATGTKNNHDYCVSNIGMTWWSAFTWCQAQKRTLATWAEACPGSNIGSTCTNFQNSGLPTNTWAWLNQIPNNSTTNAYDVDVSSGTVSGALGRKNANHSYYAVHALCY